MTQTSLHRYLRYGKSLANSGATGVRNGSTTYLNGRPLSTALGASARSSIPFAVIGIGAGLLQLALGSRCRRVPRSIAVGAVGATLGFLAGFSWKTRELAGSMAHGAIKSIGATRDNHWLEQHPIDYA
jgi:hypothetical protein